MNTVVFATPLTVRLCAIRALLGRVTRSMRSVQVAREDDGVRLYFVVDFPLHESTRRAIEAVRASISATFPELVVRASTITLAGTARAVVAGAESVCHRAEVAAASDSRRRA